MSLIAVHLALWTAPAGYGNRPPASAADFAELFGDAWYGIALWAHISAVALVIGVGTGVVVALVSVGARAWRVRRER